MCACVCVRAHFCGIYRVNVGGVFVDFCMYVHVCCRISFYADFADHKKFKNDQTNVVWCLL